MRRKPGLVFLFMPVFIINILFTGCSGKDVSKTLYDRTDFAMDTIVSQKVFGDKKGIVMEKAINRIRELESKFSMYIEGSDVYKINNNSGIAPVEASRETLDAINKSLYYSEISNGAYDLTIGPLVALWDISGGKTEVPSLADIQKALELVDYRKIIISGKQVMLEARGQAIDLGSLGKGIACDEVVNIYRENNISGIVSVGGNIGAVGSKPDGSPWVVGVRDPRGDAGDLIGTIKLKDMCAATSGDYERYFEKDGKRYHHIFDPATGFPSESGLISVTIVSRSGADCDALSTTCFVLGLEKSLNILGRFDAEAIFVDNDKNVYVTHGLKDYFKFSGAEKGYKLNFIQSE